MTHTAKAALLYTHHHMQCGTVKENIYHVEVTKTPSACLEVEHLCYVMAEKCHHSINC